MRRLARLAAGLVFAAALPAAAQDAYPSRPIRLIVPFTAGGGSDLVARSIGQKLSESWKQPVVIDNRPGGNTVIGAELTARSAPDGHTLMLTVHTTLVVNPALYPKLPYDPVRDFTPITLTHTNPMVIAVNPAAQAKNLAELLAQAKAAPGKMFYAHGAMPALIAGEVLQTAAGIKLAGVPYKGSASALTDVVGGTVPLIIDSIQSSLAFIRNGQLRAIAVTGAQRAAVLPQVPTVAEAGLPGYDVAVWSAIVAPAGLPRDLQIRLSVELARIVQLPDMRERFSGTGANLIGSSPEELARVIREDLVKYAQIIKTAGIRVD